MIPVFDKVLLSDFGPGLLADGITESVCCVFKVNIVFRTVLLQFTEHLFDAANRIVGLQVLQRLLFIFHERFSRDM